MRLMREIRFSVGSPPDSPVLNSWAGWPPALGVQAYLVIRVTVQGQPDPQTGYLCNIREIDELLRERTIPLVNRLVRDAAADPDASNASLTGERLVHAVADDLASHAPSATRWVKWRVDLTPFLAYEIGDDDMIRVTQGFEFAAAHRLHCPTLGAEQNRNIFGKCNNPNGHGHNYQLEVTIAGRPDPATGSIIPLHRLEQIVKERVIDRLDHKHLNEDCPEFADLNPTVEHIARVIWDLLDGRFVPARLAQVRVWETPKTCAEYEGPDQ